MDEYVFVPLYLGVFLLFFGRKRKSKYIYFFGDEYRESDLELLQRYRRDRQMLLDFILSGSLIQKVVMPPGAVTLDDVDLDQVSVDYVLKCARKGSLCVYFHNQELLLR